MVRKRSSGGYLPDPDTGHAAVNPPLSNLKQEALLQKNQQIDSINHQFKGHHALSDSSLYGGPYHSQKSSSSAKKTLQLILTALLSCSLVIVMHVPMMFRFQLKNLFQNPKALTELEEMLGLKFIDLQQYEDIQNKIKDGRILLLKEKMKLEELLEFEKSHEESHSNLSREHLSLLRQAELDQFCGSCAFNEKFTCDYRVQHVMEKYGVSSVQAKLFSMPTCSKKSSDFNFRAFCGDCQYNKEFTCGQYLSYKLKKEHKPIVEVMGELMPVCKNPLVE